MLHFLMKKQVRLFWIFVYYDEDLDIHEHREEIGNNFDSECEVCVRKE